MRRNTARRLVEVAKRDGGFTYDPASNSHPQSGFAFSEAPEHECKVIYLTPRVIRRYVREHAQALRSRGAHLGAWRDGGVWYLDVSHVEVERAVAVALAKVARQLAVYDLATRESFML